MGYLVHHQVQKLSNRKEAQCEDYQKNPSESCHAAQLRIG